MDANDLVTVIMALANGMSSHRILEVALQSIEEGCRRCDVCDTDILEIMVKKLVKQKGVTKVETTEASTPGLTDEQKEDLSDEACELAHESMRLTKGMHRGTILDIFFSCIDEVSDTYHIRSVDIFKILVKQLKEWKG